MNLLILLENFLLFAAIIGTSDVPCVTDDSTTVSLFTINQYPSVAEKHSLAFFSEAIVLELPCKTSDISEFHGKFFSEIRIRKNIVDIYEMDLLKECSSFAYDLVELNEQARIKKRKKKFVAKFKTFLSANHDKKKISNTLCNRHCAHAIASCTVDDFGAEFLKKLFVDSPLFVTKQLRLFGNLDDFSFMTKELADIYYKDCNYLLAPFILRALVSTVSLPVIVHLLEKWDYDLRPDDARNVMEYWGGNPEFVFEVEKDPRSWLLWTQVGIFKPFPMDQLMTELEEDNPFPKFYIYSNLILAFVHDSEIYMNNAMRMLEHIHAEFHKNDVIQEEFMTPEMVEAFDSRKWDLWKEWGQPQLDSISEIMSHRKRLIEKLISFEVNNSEIKSEELKNQFFLKNLITIMSVPLNHFSRKTFLKSRNIDEVIAAQQNYAPIWFGPTPFPRIENLMNENYWIVLWKQLEVFDIELIYDEVLSRNEMCFLLSNLAYQISDFQFSIKKIKNIFWISRLALSIITPMSDDFGSSSNFIDVINNLNGFHPIRLQPHQIDIMKSHLDPEILEVHLFKFENAGFVVDAYLYAPEILSRDDIYSLLKEAELRKLSLEVKPINIMKLRYLNDFTTEDFVEYFKVGEDFHLEIHEALYTADSSAIAGYFKVVQRACNYPEQLIWWVHLSAFNNLEFTDIVSEIITFSVFVKYPVECEELNLAVIINDIVGRIQRNPSENPQKLIIRWLLNMEWLIFQFYNYFFIETYDRKYIAVQQWDKIFRSFLQSKTKLLEWINAPENISALNQREGVLRLLNWVPMSYLGASFVYQYSLLEFSDTDAFNSVKGSHRYYDLFSSKSRSKISMKDIENAVNESIAICKVLILFDFNDIEKQIWSTRIEIFSYATVMKYNTHPIPKKDVSNLISYKSAPHYDLKILFLFLNHRGQSSFITGTGEFNPDKVYLETIPQLAACQNQMISKFELVIKEKRTELLKIDLDNAKKAKMLAEKKA